MIVQINDLGLYQELDKIPNIVKYFLIGNIIATFLNLGFQVWGLRFQKHINRVNIREVKRMEIQTILFNFINEMRDLEDDALTNKIRETHKYLNSNLLFIENNIEKLTHEICDYFTTVTFSIRNKDVHKESKFVSKFRNLFN